jgi:glyoxylase-like metal-dependent hydrolase (beta-lactamase superfamily II)
MKLGINTMTKLLKLFTVSVSLLILQACNSTKPLNEEMKLYVLDCGTITVKDISLFSPGVDVGKSKKLSNSCYLIKHPQGNFLWDTGLNDELVAMEHGLTVVDGMFTLEVKNPLVAQLKEIGLTPTDIDYMALSHLHFDHTGNMNLFSNADILLQNRELSVAFSDKAKELHFDPSTYSALDKSKFVGLDGRYDVFNDGKVVLIPAPGHSPGHQTLLVNL